MIHQSDQINDSFNPYWQIAGAWARPISGKLIQIRTSFPEIDLAHTPEVEISKNTGWVFQKSVCDIPGKTEISGTFLDEFLSEIPGFASKG